MDAVLRWLARVDVLLQPIVDGNSVSVPEEVTGEIPAGLGFLRDTYGLEQFDLDALAIALAPEVELRYRGLYAHLHGDPARPWPTVGLVLDLLCDSPAAKLSARRHFAADSALLRAGLIRLIRDPRAPLPAWQIEVDEQITDLLLGVPCLDRRLASWCDLREPSSGLADLPWVDPSVAALVDPVCEGRPISLYFRAVRGAGRLESALALAAESKVPCLVAELVKAPESTAEFAESLRVLWREAALFGAAIVLRNLDALAGEPRHALLTGELHRAPGLLVITGEAAWEPVGEPVVVVQIGTPDFAGREACWQACLANHGLKPADGTVAFLAQRFRLNPGQVESTVRYSLAIGDMSRDGLSRAARAQTGHQLAALARKVDPRATWDQIVLPDDTIAQLEELCDRASARSIVLDDWGFGRRLSVGTGTTALFLGPSGTGKSFAAEIIAGALGLDLYKIDLAGVVSKYIGETEKNLERIFRAATDANGVLFFDEAESLFGKRSEVKDSHDRYANIEVAYLLQKMEEYDGIAILATNLRDTLDPAFVRRLAFSIHFPFPTEESRRRIWHGIWPAEIPLAPDLDLDWMADEFTLSGGNIKNVALAAAFQAASDGRIVTNKHLRHAVRREFQKLGRDLIPGEASS